MRDATRETHHRSIMESILNVGGTQLTNWNWLMRNGLELYFLGKIISKIVSF